MLWLQSNEKHDVLAELEPATGQWRQRSRSRLGASSPRGVQGFFALLSGTFTALYRYGDALFIHVGGTPHPLRHDTAIRVEGPPQARLLRISLAGRDVEALPYAVELPPSLPGDLTAFVEAEDFDFGLFVSNVSRSEERKAVLLDVWRPTPA